MTDQQGADRRGQEPQPDPDATPARGVPAVPPAPTPPAAGAQPNPFAPPSGAAQPHPQPSSPAPHPPQAQPQPQPGLTATAAGPAAPGTTAPAPDRRGRRRVLAWTGAGAAAALVLTGAGLGVAGLVRDDAGGGDAGGAEVAQAALGDPEFDEVLLDIEPTHVFTIPIGWQPEELPDAPGIDGVVQVFADAQLTVPAADATPIVTWDGEISISPPSYALPATVPDFADPFADGTQIELNAEGEWGLYERYYIAEYRDRKTGEQLPEPRVTAFTVAGDGPAVPFATRVDEQGVGHFSWDEVEGADEYLVVRADDMGVQVVGTTTGTAWTTVEQDADIQEALAAEDVLEREIFRMNGDFETDLFNQDDAVDGFTNTGGIATAPGFGVVAVVDGEPGPLAVQPGGDLVRQLPAIIAMNAADEMGVSPGDVDTLDQLPTTYPVSLADGSTVVRPITYDADGITDAEVLTGTEDDAGNVTLTGKRIDYRIPYRVIGTMFTGTYTVEAADRATARAGALAAAERAAAERARTGDEQAYQYVEVSAGGPADDSEISRTAPEVPYAVNGSTPLTTYIAANLLDGQRYVDVSAYLGKGATVTPTGVSLWDAFHEAVSQNPLALVYGRIGVGYSADQQLLSISYQRFDGEEERVAEQEAVAAEIERVVGEVVDDGMSDEQKVVALNGYLAEHAEYDYDALATRDDLLADEVPHAWVATGVLLDGRGVCASYAQAFKALADAAGLTSVYVTGTATVSGEGHAWNKVQVDGAWRVVDPTWNDSPVADQYLLQTDEQAAADRTEDAEWILDSRIGEFAAL